MKLFVLLRRRTEPSSQFLSDVGLVDCVSSLTTFLLPYPVAKHTADIFDLSLYYTFLDSITVSGSLSIEYYSLYRNTSLGFGVLNFSVVYFFLSWLFKSFTLFICAVLNVEYMPEESIAYCS